MNINDLLYITFNVSGTKCNSVQMIPFIVAKYINFVVEIMF